MKNFKTLLSATSLTPLTLAVAHNVTVNELDGIAVKNAIDLAYVHRRLPYILATFIPPADRDAVVASLDRLSVRIAKSGLPQTDTDEVVTMISKGIPTIETQPEKMPPQQNGAGTTEPHAQKSGTDARPQVS